MSHLLIFIFGCVITAIAIAAAFLVGLSEADDPAHNQTGEYP